MKSKKEVGVFFSGGLDSTYLVWKNLKEGNTVVPMYIEVMNNKNKTILEKNRIKLLHDEFRKEFGYNIDRIKYPIVIDILNRGNLYLNQVPIWILGALFSQDVSEIQIGYVSNDDAISYLDDIKKMYNEYNRISAKLVPITFPLSKHSKIMMMDELPQKYSNLIVSCENPKIIGSKDNNFIEYEPCCTCVPCTHIISSKYYNTRRFPKIYENQMKLQKLNEIISMGYSVINSDGTEFKTQDTIQKSYPLSYQLKIDFEYEESKFDEAKYNSPCDVQKISELLSGS
jgi:hypothetical protein